MSIRIKDANHPETGFFEISLSGNGIIKNLAIQGFNRFIPPTYTAYRTEAGYPVPTVDLIREHVGIVMDLPPAEAMEALGLDPLDDACG